MKRVLLILISLSSMFFVSCSNMEVGFEKESIFYGGGVVYIYLDKNADKNAQYKVYINGEDSDVTLTADTKTRFGIKSGKTNITITKGNQKASIDLILKASKNYYFTVSENSDGKLQIVKVQKENIAKDVKSTALYVDENKEEKDNTTSISTIKETPQAKIKKKLQKKQNDTSETTFYYDPNDGE